MPFKHTLFPAATAFMLLAVCYIGLYTKTVFPIDETVAYWAISFRSDTLSPWLKFITDMYTPLASISFFVALTSVLIIVRRYREALYFFITLNGAWLIKTYLKSLIMRPRPPYKIIDIGGYSFPSGHSTLSMATGIGLYMIARHLRNNDRFSMVILGFALLWAGLIGFTRLYFGAHWMSDVVAGWSLGFGWAYLMAYLFFPQSFSSPKGV